MSATDRIDAAPLPDAPAIAANCDGNLSPEEVTQEMSYGRHCLFMAACCDLEARAEDFRCLAYAAWHAGFESDKDREELIAGHKRNAAMYRQTASNYRDHARAAGESIPAPTMSGMISAVREAM